MTVPSSSAGSPQDARQAVLDNWYHQLQAMDAADTDALRACFLPDAHLVHMTGHRQPLDEWMAGIERREFVYHRLSERSEPRVEVQGTGAHLVGRITTGQTDDGSGQAWPLTVDQDLVADARGRWLCRESRVTFG